MKKYEKDPEKRKIEALKIMELLEMDTQTIKDYRESNLISRVRLEPIKEKETNEQSYIMIIDRGLDPELESKIKDLERTYNFTCFYVMQNKTPYGVMESLLLISQYLEEWQRDEADAEHEDEEDGHREILAYVLNTTDPELSEFGYIGIKKIHNWYYRIY